MTRGGRAPTSYLLGSIHVLPEDHAGLSERLHAAYDATDRLVVEADTEAVSMLRVLWSTVREGAYPPGDDLERHLPPSTWDRLRRSVGEAGVPAFVLRRLKPWLASLLLVGQALERQGYSGETGVDTTFLRRAHADHKPVVELESVDGQIRMLSGLPDDVQVLLIEDALRGQATDDDALAQVLGAWLAGDVAGLEAATLSYLTARPELAPLHDVLFVRRNQAMTGRLLELLDGPGSVLVVVGAGHLVGTKGLLALLRARGVALTQMRAHR